MQAELVDALVQAFVRPAGAATGATRKRKRTQESRFPPQDPWPRMKELALQPNSLPILVSCVSQSLTSSNLTERTRAVELLDRLFDTSEEFRHAAMTAGNFRVLFQRLVRNGRFVDETRALLSSWASRHKLAALTVALRNLGGVEAPQAPPAAPSAASTAIVQAWRCYKGRAEPDASDELGVLLDADAKLQVVASSMELLGHPVFAAIQEEVEWESDDEGKAREVVAGLPDDYRLEITAHPVNEDKHDIRQCLEDARTEIERSILPGVSRMLQQLEGHHEVRQGLEEMVEKLKAALGGAGGLFDT